MYIYIYALLSFSGMGHLHLTFEHNAHKGTLKIKVWQLSNLLLPPRKSYSFMEKKDAMLQVIQI